MIGQSHLIVMSTVAEQRSADLHAEAARHRLGHLAGQRADHRDAWPDVVAVVAVVLLLALLFATGSDVAAAQTVNAGRL
jgi:hypothetical protein